MRRSGFLRAFSLLLAAAMLCSMIQLPVFAEELAEEEYIFEEVTESTEAVPEKTTVIEDSDLAEVMMAADPSEDCVHDWLFEYTDGNLDQDVLMCSLCYAVINSEHVAGEDGNCIYCEQLVHEHFYEVGGGYDEYGHNRICSICGKCVQADHEFADGVCKVCGYRAHTHVFTPVPGYTYDEEAHLAVCSVCNDSRYVAHSFDDSGVCSCGYQNHVHDTVFSDFCERWEDGHNVQCSSCGVILTQPHSMVNGVCSACGYFAHEHIYKTAESVDPTGHLASCNICGERSWGAHTLQNGVCTFCGYKEHAHNFTKVISFNDDEHILACSECGEYGWFEHDFRRGVCTGCGFIQHEHEWKFVEGSDVYPLFHLSSCETCKIVTSVPHELDENGKCKGCPYWEHEHNYVYDSSFARWEQTHFLRCADCDTLTEQRHEMVAGTCTVCGYVLHTHDFQYVGGRQYPNSHEVTCSICADHYEFPHDFVDNTCAVCGYRNHEHHFALDRTQSDQSYHCQVCRDCGSENYELHTFNDVRVCTVCGYSAGELVITAPADFLMAGKNMTLTATLSGRDAKCTWSLEGTGARLDSKGKLTADSKLAEKQVVTVTAATEDGRAASVTVTLYPLAQSVRIQRWESDITGKTMTFADFGDGIDILDFTAEAVPGDSGLGVSWTVSGVKGTYDITRETPNGIVLENIRVPEGKASTKLTLTATAKDGSGKKASATVSIVRAAADFTIIAPAAMTAGKSVNLSTTISGRKDLADNKLTWFLPNAQDASFVTLTEAGKLSVNKDFVREQNIEIGVRTLVGDVRTCTIRLEPLPASAKITSSKPIGADGMITVKRRLGGYEPLNLRGSVSPASANQEGTWKISGPAAIDAGGNVTFTKDGIATVTFTAKESKVSATVRVRAGYPVETIDLTCPDTVIASGKKITIKAAVNAGFTAPYIKDLEWTSSDPGAATVKGGVVTAQNVYEEKVVTITASAADGSGVSASMTFIIVPKDGSMPIRRNGVIVNDTTIAIDCTRESTLRLTAPEGAVWSSGNKKSVSVDENGLVTVLKPGAAVKLTAKIGNQSASVTVLGVIPVAGITLSTKDNPIFTIGKGKFTAKANIANADATNKNVVWSVDRPDLAAISASGKLTVKDGVTGAHQIMVTATAADGFGASASAVVTLVPAATVISLSSDAYGRLNNRTITVSMKDGPIVLNSMVNPMDESGSANQTVEWKSSAAKNAAISAAANGNATVTLLKPGKTTITATAVDGTGVTAKFTLIITE